MTANNFNYHRIEAMSKRIEELETEVKRVEELNEWLDSFVDYVEHEYVSTYNEACQSADEVLELEDRVNYESSEGDIQEELYTNAYAKPLEFIN